MKNKKVVESSSDPQTDIQFVAVESQQAGVNQEEVVIEIARSLTKELGTLTTHLVKQKIVEDAEKSSEGC